MFAVICNDWLVKHVQTCTNKSEQRRYIYASVPFLALAISRIRVLGFVLRRSYGDSFADICVDIFWICSGNKRFVFCRTDCFVYLRFFPEN